MIILLIIFLVFLYLNHKFPPNSLKTPKCVTHKWRYDDFDTLRCEQCKKTPEQLIKESNW